MIMLLSSVVLFSSYTTHKVVVRLFWSLLFLLFLIAAVVQPFQVTTSGAKRKSNTKSTKHREILLLRTTSRRMAASSSSKSSKSYPSEWIVSSLPLSSSSKKQKCNRNDGTTGHSTADDADGNNKDEKSKERHNILRRTHLVLHLDINETILLGDAAGGDTRNESTQKLLANWKNYRNSRDIIISYFEICNHLFINLNMIERVLGFSPTKRKTTHCFQQYSICTRDIYHYHQNININE